MTFEASTKLTFTSEIRGVLQPDPIEWRDLVWSVSGELHENGIWDFHLTCTKKNDRFVIWNCYAFGDIVVDGQRFEWANAFFKDVTTTTVVSKYPLIENVASTSKIDIVVFVNVTSSYCVNLQDPMNSMIRSEQDRAVTHVDGTVLYLSKAFLQDRSPFFNSLFNLDFKEKLENRFELRELNIDHFVNLLSYMYPADRKINSMEMCEQLLNVVDRFGCDSVKAVCEMYLVHAGETTACQDLNERYALGIVNSNPCAFSVPPRESEVSTLEMTVKAEEYENPFALAGKRWPLKEAKVVYSSNRVNVGDFTWRVHAFSRTPEEIEQICVECTRPENLVMWRCEAFGEIVIEQERGEETKKILSECWREQFSTCGTSKFVKIEKFMQNLIKGDLKIRVNVQIIRSYCINLYEPNCIDSMCLIMEGQKLYVSKKLLYENCGLFRTPGLVVLLDEDGQETCAFPEVKIKDFVDFLAFLYPISDKIECSANVEHPHPDECIEEVLCTSLADSADLFGCQLVKNVCEAHILRYKLPVERDAVINYKLDTVRRRRFGN